jgi:predicted O-methyltransferase YrrM
MQKIQIKDKLIQLGVSLDDVVLGDYDFISRFTAEKHRNHNDPLYKSAGCFYTPNRERAILICSLMKQYGLKSFLEIGFGRGYTSVCVSKLMTEMGILDSKIVSIDMNIDKDHLNLLSKIFSPDWLEKISLFNGKSSDILPTISDKFDLIYIDGGHLRDEVQSDWDLCKDKFNSILVFDDYMLPTKKDPGLQIAEVVDQISADDVDCNEPELVITDRRIFLDDRRLADDQVDYGQVVFTKKSASLITELW